jgi:hypothetical protein
LIVATGVGERSCNNCNNHDFFQLKIDFAFLKQGFSASPFENHLNGSVATSNRKTQKNNTIFPNEYD